MSEYFTDEEYRILLFALSRERTVCEKVDKGCKGYGQDEHKLSNIMTSIETKIKKIQYQEGE